MSQNAAIGKIVRSESHVRYTCQIFGPGEVPAPPEPADYAFGTFVRIPLRITSARAANALPPPLASSDARVGPDSDVSADVALVPAARTGAAWAVGLIYDTILLNPAFGTLGPRLSNDEQVELFSPDYLSERAVLVSILLLGTLSGGASMGAHHGVPPVAPDLGAEVSPLPDAALRAFHLFADHGVPGGARPYLHMGYLPHAVAQDNPLLPLALLRTIERLERVFPENAALLSIVKRNFAWRLKVQTAG
jgi:hypothetical protein